MTKCSNVNHIGSIVDRILLSVLSGYTEIKWWKLNYIDGCVIVMASNASGAAEVEREMENVEEEEERKEVRQKAISFGSKRTRFGANLSTETDRSPFVVYDFN